MESGFFIFVIVAVFIALAAVGWYFSAKRRKELAAWAAARGLTFSPGHDRGVDARFPDFGCLRQGSDRSASNITQGNWNGREILAFDYEYTTGSGKDRTTHTFSAVILASRVPLRPLFIRHEGLLDKVAAFFGHEDINFESAEFSRRFHVTSPDRKWAYDVLHPRAIEFLLGSPEFTLQFDSQCAIAYRSSTFSAAQFEAAAGVIAGLLDRLPEYVVRQQMGTT